MQRAEELTAGCDDCLSNLYWRSGVVSCHQMAPERGLSLLDRALMHAEKAGDDRCVSNVLLYRSWAHGFFDMYATGFEDVKRAIGLITPDMPSRRFVTAAVNVLALAVCLGEKAKIKEALRMAEDLKALIKGLYIHARARPMLRWIRGLGHERVGEIKEAVRALESAIRGLERFNMLDEQKAAMADLARIRRMGKQLETNERYVRRLVETRLRLETDPETIKILKRAQRDPSIENLLAWRSRSKTRLLVRRRSRCYPWPMQLDVEFDHEQDGRWIAEIVTLPGVMAYDRTEREALAAAKALALRILADKLEHGELAIELGELSYRVEAA